LHDIAVISRFIARAAGASKDYYLIHMHGGGGGGHCGS
jgi:hypothetical protein